MCDLSLSGTVPTTGHTYSPKGLVPLPANALPSGTATGLTHVTDCSGFPGTEAVHGVHDFLSENGDSPRQTRMNWSLYLLVRYVFSMTGVTGSPPWNEGDAEGTVHPGSTSQPTDRCPLSQSHRSSSRNSWPGGRIRSGACTLLSKKCGQVSWLADWNLKHRYPTSIEKPRGLAVLGCRSTWPQLCGAVWRAPCDTGPGLPALP